MGLGFSAGQKKDLPSDMTLGFDFGERDSTLEASVGRAGAHVCR